MWHVPLSPTALDTKFSQRICFTQQFSHRSPPLLGGYVQDSPSWLMAGGKDTFFKADTKVRESTLAVVSCVILVVIVSVERTFIWGGGGSAASSQRAQSEDGRSGGAQGTTVTGSLPLASSCPSPDSFGLTRALEKTIIERQHWHYGDAPSSASLSTRDSPSLALTQARLSSPRRLKSLRRQEWAAVS